LPLNVPETVIENRRSMSLTVPVSSLVMPFTSHSPASVVSAPCVTVQLRVYTHPPWRAEAEA
jgi:hypothetical protein